MNLNRCFLIGILFVCTILYFFADKPFSGPLSGAIIGATIAVFSNQHFKEIESKAQKKALCGALQAELTEIRNVAESRLQMMLALQGQNNTYALNIHISEDYFTVFTQNAGRLGLLKPSTSQIVIKSYIEAKGLFDTARMYSRYSDELVPIRRKMQELEVSGPMLGPDYSIVKTELDQRLSSLKDLSEKITQQYVPMVVLKINDANNLLIEETSNWKSDC